MENHKDQRSLINLALSLVELDPSAEENKEVVTNLLTSLGEKVDSYYHVNRVLETELSRLKAEKEHYSVMVKRHEDAIEKLKERAQFAMQTLGVKSLKSTNGYSISLRPSDSVVIDDLSALPDWATETTVETVAKKTEIKEAIKSGDQVPGARLKKTEHVQISGPKAKRVQA